MADLLGELEGYAQFRRRLGDLAAIAAGHSDGGGLVDLSTGAPCDPPPEAVLAILSSTGAERSYGPSAGSPDFRDAAAGWLRRRFGLDVPSSLLAVCLGAKEFIASTPRYLRLREPARDTVLYPAVSYPTYGVGARLAGCRAVPYRDVDDVDEGDASRALCMWVNSPSNPTGKVVDLARFGSWGRARGVPILSDECYAEFSWVGPPETMLSSGISGVLAVHSLAKRSNMAGCRVGFYGGDPELVRYLSSIRRSAGLIVPGPMQAAGAVALADDAHVELQRSRYLARLRLLAGRLGASLPAGGIYLWLPASSWAAGGECADGWGLASELARRAGALVLPGEMFGREGKGHIRLAMVQPDEKIALVADRLLVDQ